MLQNMYIEKGEAKGYITMRGKQIQLLPLEPVI